MPGLIRHPAVAGRFYPSDPADLLESVNSYSQPRDIRVPAIACIVPHAGYVYSGPTAGAVFSHIKIPARCLILCPNHTGCGMPLSIMSLGAWETPMGMVEIDSELAEQLKERFPPLSEDRLAHHSEHAIEVELPFLQVLAQTSFSFVPIALGTQDFELLRELGTVVAEVVGSQSEPALIIASSDMNHYENDSITRVKDRFAIEQILALDPAGLFEVVRRERISMCGLGPAVVALVAAGILGAKSAELLAYATSAEISGDHERVVGYAGIAIY